MAWGVGQIAAGLTIRRYPATTGIRRDLLPFAVAIFAVSACWLVSAALPVVEVVIAIQLVGGAGGAVAFAIRQTHLQRRTPPALAGRVFTATDALLNAGQFTGVVIAGIAAGAVGARGSYAIAGTLALIGAAVVAHRAPRPKPKQSRAHLVTATAVAPTAAQRQTANHAGRTAGQFRRDALAEARGRIRSRRGFQVAASLPLLQHPTVLLLCDPPGLVVDLASVPMACVPAR